MKLIIAFKKTVLETAIQKGNIEIVELLIKCKSINICPSERILIYIF